MVSAPPGKVIVTKIDVVVFDMSSNLLWFFKWCKINFIYDCRLSYPRKNIYC